MQLFLDTLASVGGVIAAIILGIAVLAVFFKVLSWFDVGGDADPLAVTELVTPNTDATVHLLGGRVFEKVRVSGLGAGYAYATDGLVTLEDSEGNRYLVREKHIRLIVVPAESNDSSVVTGESP